jgi:2-iminobutanoate/2-iminopropanoate deaminase
MMRPQPIAMSNSAGTPMLFSAAVVAGQFVFVSGQVGWDPETRLAPAGISAQTELALRNVSAVLEAAGTSLEYVCKVNVFLTNMSDFPAMNDVYRGYFPNRPPARTTVGAALARPDLLIEVDAIALLPDQART